MNVAAGLAANGDLIVIASGWTHRPRKGEGTAGHQPPAHTLLPWVCRSTDGGRTWARAETLAPPEGVRNVVPFGNVVAVADGSLGVCLYANGSTFFYASADDGLTWSLRAVLQREDINETALATLANGQILACARTVGDQHLEMFRSTDHGRTWTCEQAVSKASQHPAHLLALDEGRVVLTYGDRRDGHQGIEVRVSADGGRSWGEPMRLVDLSLLRATDHGRSSGDLGYPATILGKRGTLVTAWYSAGVAAHQRYHMGVAIWTLEASSA
jgi:photosystem II stability/assembly factor-like uncharacterized protein